MNLNFFNDLENNWNDRFKKNQVDLIWLIPWIWNSCYFINTKDYTEVKIFITVFEDSIFSQFAKSCRLFDLPLQMEITDITKQKLSTTMNIIHDEWSPTKDRNKLEIHLVRIDSCLCICYINRAIWLHQDCCSTYRPEVLESTFFRSIDNRPLN